MNSTSRDNIMKGKTMKGQTKFLMIKLSGLAILLMSICTSAGGEDANNLEQTKEVLTTLEQRMQKTITVNFPETEIKKAVRSMAKMADLDVVMSPDVSGMVTASLTDVPLSEALHNILAAHGYGYEVDKNVIRIAPMSEFVAKQEKLVSRIYRITYADVSAVEEALDKFVTKGTGVVSSSPGTSNIIVTDTESKVKAIDKFIQEIDRRTPQILVEVRIYDITSRDKLDLGIEWAAGRNTTIGGTLGNNPTAGNRRPFMEGTFSADTGKTSDDFVGDIRLGWLSGGIDIDSVIRARKEKAHAKLLANPRIMVLDNETANFDIVTENPYAERTITASTVTETIKYKMVGVKLNVTPHLTREEMIKLHIAPEFSVVVRQAQFATSEVPVVDTRKVNTTALIRDGQTVVLGGLRKKDVSQQKNKIPILGDIPLIGLLFRFEGEDTAHTELIVFITPRIMNEPITMSGAEKEAYTVTEFGGPKPLETKAEKSSSEKEK